MFSRSTRAARAAAVAAAVAGSLVLSGCATVESARADAAAAEAAAASEAAVAASLDPADAAASEEVVDTSTIPADWPKEIPIYEKGTVDNVSVTPDTGDAVAVWLSDDAYDVAAKEYNDLLIAAGFKLDVDTTSEGFAGGEYSGNGYSVSVSAFDAGGTQLAVTATKSV